MELIPGEGGADFPGDPAHPPNPGVTPIADGDAGRADRHIKPPAGIQPPGQHEVYKGGGPVIQAVDMAILVQVGVAQADQQADMEPALARAHAEAVIERDGLAIAETELDLKGVDQGFVHVQTPHAQRGHMDLIAGQGLVEVANGEAPIRPVLYNAGLHEFRLGRIVLSKDE